MASALAEGRTTFWMGNGGSAADAQHIAAELVGKLRRARQALPAVALTTNTSILTAVANDISFEEVFTRQVEALVREGDLLIGLSTSGNSANVVRAIQAGNWPMSPNSASAFPPATRSAFRNATSPSATFSAASSKTFWRN